MNWIQQTQEYADCRLIAAANAALFLGLNPIRPEENPLVWKQFVCLAKAEYGAAIAPEKFDEIIGINVQPYQPNWKLKDLAIPSILNIFDPIAGFHAVLIAEINTQIGVVGFNYQAKVIYFTFEELESLLPNQNNINRQAYRVKKI